MRITGRNKRKTVGSNDSHIVQLLDAVLIIAIFLLALWCYNVFNTRKQSNVRYDPINNYFDINVDSIQGPLFISDKWEFFPNLRTTDIAGYTTIDSLKSYYTHASFSQISSSGWSDLGPNVIWHDKNGEREEIEFKSNGMPTYSGAYATRIHNSSTYTNLYLDLGDINGTAFIYCNGVFIGEAGNKINYDITPNYNAGHSSFALQSDKDVLEVLVICYSNSRIYNPGLVSTPTLLSSKLNTIFSSIPSGWLAIIITLTVFAIIAGYHLSRTFKDSRVYTFFVLTIANIVMYQIVDNSFISTNSTIQQAGRTLFFIGAVAFSYCFVSFIFKNKDREFGSADAIAVSCIGVAFIALNFLDSRLLSTPYNEVIAIIYATLITSFNIIKSLFSYKDSKLATFASFSSISIFFIFYAMLAKIDELCNVSLYSIFYFFSIIAICWYFINQYITQYNEILNTSTHLKYTVEQKTAYISEINKDLINTNKRLMENEEARKNVMSNVSHDLRTPITAIRGYAELLLKSSIPESQKEIYLTNILKRSQQMERIVSDIVEISKMEATNFEFDFMDVSLNEFLDELYMLYSADLSETKRMVIEVPEDDLLIVRADPKRISRVFENLISNAINYSKEEALIEIKAWRTNSDKPLAEQEVHITVTDNGIGIPNDEIPHIFDRFYRAKNSGQNIKGTGLGLSIVKMIIDKHDAQIDVTSTLGEGTTFHIIMKPSY